MVGVSAALRLDQPSGTRGGGRLFGQLRRCQQGDSRPKARCRRTRLGSSSTGDASHFWRSPGERSWSDVAGRPAPCVAPFRRSRHAPGRRDQRVRPCARGDRRGVRRRSRARTRRSAPPSSLTSNDPRRSSIPTASRSNLRVPATVVSHPLARERGQMRERHQGYATYSIGCAVVWAAILGVLAARGEKKKLRRILPVFGGWWMGWTSATIARSVYPPPKSRPPRGHDHGT